MISLQEELNAYCWRERMSHNKFAKSIEVNPVYIYQIKRGMVDLAPKGVQKRVAEGIGLKAEFVAVVGEHGRVKVNVVISRIGIEV